MEPENRPPESGLSRAIQETEPDRPAETAPLAIICG